MKTRLIYLIIMFIFKFTLGRNNCHGGGHSLSINSQPINLTIRPCQLPLFTATFISFRLCAIRRVHPTMCLTIGGYTFNKNSTKLSSNIRKSTQCISRNFKIPARNFSIQFEVDDECNSKFTCVCSVNRVDPGDSTNETMRVKRKVTNTPILANRHATTQAEEEEYEDDDEDSPDATSRPGNEDGDDTTTKKGSSHVSLYLVALLPVAFIITCLGAVMFCYKQNQLCFKKAPAEPIKEVNVTLPIRQNVYEMPVITSTVAVAGTPTDPPYMITTRTETVAEEPENHPLGVLAESVRKASLTLVQSVMKGSRPPVQDVVKVTRPTVQEFVKVTRPPVINTKKLSRIIESDAGRQTQPLGPVSRKLSRKASRKESRSTGAGSRRSSRRQSHGPVSKMPDGSPIYESTSRSSSDGSDYDDSDDSEALSQAPSRSSSGKSRPRSNP